MKTKISTLLCLFALVFNAQTWNKTFDINNNGDFLSPSFLIGTSDLGSASVSWGNDAPTTPRRDYFIVTKHDANGNTMFNTMVFPNSSPNDGYTEVKAMIETKDRGIFISGYYYYDNSFIMQPFLVKLDYFGTYQWTRWYPVNSNFYTGHEFNKISLARVEDDEKENYFIVSCADSDVNPSRDEVVNVIKVDENGSLIWSKKYFDSNSQPYYFSNRPGDITFSPDDRMYMITGWRQEFYSPVVERMFFYGIDRDGNVVTNFKTLKVPGIPYGQDMVYDPNTRNFAVAFTHGGLDPSDYNFTYSTIGLITIDAALNVNLHRMFWHPEAKENRGFSISLSRTGDYVIGCDTYDGSFGVRNPSLLRVDNAGNSLMIMKYNIYDDVLFGHHCNSYNSITGDEEYVLVGENRTDLRVIRADINFKTCGAREYHRIEKDYDFGEELFKYYPKEIGDEKKYKSKIKYTHVPERECFDWNYDSYRAANTTALESNLNETNSSLSIYPSQLSASQAVLTIENRHETVLSIQVLDLTGKLIYSNTNIVNGINSVNLVSQSLAEGVYLVKYNDANGQVSGAQKIIISK